MESLKAALGRLDTAVERLERAADAREHRALARERDLRNEIATAQMEQAKASAAAEDMSRRLEVAISRLEAVMEN
jgi:hypothetical protein